MDEIYRLFDRRCRVDTDLAKFAISSVVSDIIRFVNLDAFASRSVWIYKQRGGCCNPLSVSFNPEEDELDEEKKESWQ